MTKYELREAIRNQLLTICDNVADFFVFPEETLQGEQNFPYITLVMGNTVFEAGSKRGTQAISIIGMVKGDNEDLLYKRDELEKDIINSLYNVPEVKVTIDESDTQSLFKPYGLDAGVYPPYAGVRVELTLPYVVI